MRTNVSLHCDVCSNPAPHTYKWSKIDGELGNSTTGQDTDTLSIDYVLQSDFGNYTCQVTNDVSAEIFVVDLFPYGRFY